MKLSLGALVGRERGRCSVKVMLKLRPKFDAWQHYVSTVETKESDGNIKQS